MNSSESQDGIVDISVISLLPEGEPQGTYSIKVSSSALGQELLRLVCKMAMVPLNPDYILQKSDRSPISLMSKLATLNIQDESTIYWTKMSDAVHVSGFKNCNSFWFMGSLSLLIGCGGLITILYLHLHTESLLQYGIVFDAGSSHTAMFVYKWNPAKINSTAVAIQDGEKCISQGGGISSFAGNASAAGQSLVPCLDKAKKQIPSEQFSYTPVYLGATAGMRLLEKKNITASNEIMKAVQDTLTGYPFKFSNSTKQARILSDVEEGSFAWITSNYITGAFHVHPPANEVVPNLIVNSVGALDLGGASTQITFVPRNSSVPDGYKFNMQLFGYNYSLYTHSYLCYGINEVALRMQATLVKAQNFSTDIKNPCGPKGSLLNISQTDIFSSECVSGQVAELAFGHRIRHPLNIAMNTEYQFLGGGNATACRALVENTLFNLTAPCNYSECSFNGVYQPPVSDQFYAFSSYFYLMNFLNLTDSDVVNYTKFNAVSEDLCLKTWDEVKTMKTNVKENLPWYCFQALYINTLLVKGYKFDPNTTWAAIHFVESVSGTEAGWTLGFILNESNLLPSEPANDEMNDVTFALLTVLFCAFIILSIGFACKARRYNSRVQRQYNPLSSYGAI